MKLSQITNDIKTHLQGYEPLRGIPILCDAASSGADNAEDEFDAHLMAALGRGGILEADGLVGLAVIVHPVSTSEAETNLSCPGFRIRAKITVWENGITNDHAIGADDAATHILAAMHLWTHEGQKPWRPDDEPLKAALLTDEKDTLARGWEVGVSYGPVFIPMMAICAGPVVNVAGTTATITTSESGGEIWVCASENGLPSPYNPAAEKLFGGTFEMEPELSYRCAVFKEGKRDSGCVTFTT